jgi:hypothetical protein
MAMRLRQLRVRTRLYAGFGMLMALAAGVAGWAISQQTRVSSQLAIMSTQVQDLRQVDALALLLESAGRATFRFWFDADPAALSTANTDLARITEILASSSLTPAPAAKHQLYVSLQEEVAAYRSQFDRVIELQTVTAGLLNKLAVGGPSLTEEVARLVKQANATPASIAAEQALYRLRRDGLGFLSSTFRKSGGET